MIFSWRNVPFFDNTPRFEHRFCLPGKTMFVRDLRLIRVLRNLMLIIFNKFLTQMPFSVNIIFENYITGNNMYFIIVKKKTINYLRFLRDDPATRKKRLLMLCELVPAKIYIFIFIVLEIKKIVRERRRIVSVTKSIVMFVSVTCIKHVFIEIDVWTILLCGKLLFSENILNLKTKK